ncbi:hypothetical protein [Leptospira yasudae]|uniref:hypothetical protein n=1 Tax=Leptospira yasudae TaxID=2202201 RepID=UPI001090D525|nr:hypothetical protein [Leptospira yasudae]MBW0433571.1 hypothetical protein [Leptospira yasudae]TGN00490.1 hypothetical protein EHR10_02235 [Leptospira yasudae]
MIRLIRKKNDQLRTLTGFLSLLLIALFSLLQCNHKESDNNQSLLALTGTTQAVNILKTHGTTFRECDATGNPKSTTNETETSNGHTAIILKGDAQMAGGGLLVYVREMDANNTATNTVVPVVIENEVPRFITVSGKRYMAYLEFFIDGINNTEIDGLGLVVPFTAADINTVNFYVTAQKIGLFVNGNSHESNILYYPVGSNTMGNNPQERAAWRRNNYLLYGGDGFVLEYVYKVD